MSGALLAGALLAVGAVVLVAVPFLREPAPADDRLLAPDASQQRRLARAEERDRALAALKELEFDHRTGKVSDDDYSELVVVLRRRAAETLLGQKGITKIVRVADHSRSTIAQSKRYEGQYAWSRDGRRRYEGARAAAG